MRQSPLPPHPLPRPALPPPLRPSGSPHTRPSAGPRGRRWLALAAAAACATGFAAVHYEQEILSGGPRVATARDLERKEEELAVYLTRSTLLALHHANRTGDYGVFRALASPLFQQSNPAERLAAVFAPHRARSLDLGVAALGMPRWSSPPAIGPDQRLRLAGTYDTQTEWLRFKLAFEASAGAWRLFEIHVATEPRSGPHVAAAVR